MSTMSVVSLWYRLCRSEHIFCTNPSNSQDSDLAAPVVLADQNSELILLWEQY